MIRITRLAQPLLKFLPGLIPLILTTAACLALKENYPFSHFPMYKGFGDHTFFVYAADAKGDPIPVQSITHVRTSRLKKIYKGHIRKTAKGLKKRERELTIDERTPSGDETLRWLYTSTRPAAIPELDALRALRLYQVALTLENGEIKEHEPELVGEFPVPPPVDPEEPKQP